LEKEMSTKIGHFEILSELAKSSTGAVYKANDTESGQTIALKAIQLSAFGESAGTLAQALLAEAEATKVLSSPNITNVFGAGEIEGQFCAAMEYIQGNSIATMLERKEGFSIWDLLDIGRQLCSGLEHAKSHSIAHYSLEPSKIMCGWDGTVRILGYGISSVGNFVQHVPGGVPSILHYMSPEQVLADTMDARSNLFSLGAIFYEMVTERKAFDHEDAEGLRQCILDSTPVPPLHVNPKVHPLLSDLIMKALAKDPARRYQSGRELLDDLEKCKESKPAAKKAEAPKSPAVPKQTSAAAQAKFVAPAAAKPAAAPPKPPQSSVARPSSPVAPTEAKSALAKPVSKLAVPKAAAAAAGVGSGDAAAASREVSEVKATLDEPETPTASMSSAVADEPQVETFEPQVEEDGPKIAVDPMMAEGGQQSSAGVSFSEMTELPPLKEVYIPPPPPPSSSSYQPVQSAPMTPTVFEGGLKAKAKADEKPKIQPREVAEKAIKEIKSVPPKLMGYALGGAAVLILIIGIGVTIYIHSLNSDDDPGANHPAAVEDSPAQPESSQPAPKKSPAPAPVPAAAQPVETQPAATPEPEPEAPQPVASAKGRNAKKKSAPAAIIPGGLAIDSTPQGAQVQVDGRTDASYVTPFALTNMQPGQHTITVSKAGYSTDTRTVNVTSANRASALVHLAQLMATLVVKSNPPGANIYVDGRDVGTKTPAQVSVDKGQHVVLVRIPGYIDETMNAQFVLGQTFNFSPTLRSLGNTENIKTVGKMSKLFGGKGAQAGQGTVSIRTQPKGAQVAINQHMLDKNSPVDVLLDPGNYVVDITLSGYAPVHKVITADKGGKVVVDEVMQPQ
jgi:eukaryotic-like serine/threonine-protein kinase